MTTFIILIAAAAICAANIKAIIGFTVIACVVWAICSVCCGKEA